VLPSSRHQCTMPSRLIIADAIDTTPLRLLEHHHQPLVPQAMSHSHTLLPVDRTALGVANVQPRIDLGFPRRDYDRIMDCIADAFNKVTKPAGAAASDFDCRQSLTLLQSLKKCHFSFLPAYLHIPDWMELQDKQKMLSTFIFSNQASLKSSQRNTDYVHPSSMIYLICFLL
jgi:hypothetical protein